MCRSNYNVVSVYIMMIPYAEQCTNRVTRSVLETGRLHFYARPSQACITGYGPPFSIYVENRPFFKFALF